MDGVKTQQGQKRKDVSSQHLELHPKVSKSFSTLSAPPYLRNRLLFLFFEGTSANVIRKHFETTRAAMDSNLRQRTGSNKAMDFLQSKFTFVTDYCWTEAASVNASTSANYELDDKRKGCKRHRCSPTANFAFGQDQLASFENPETN